MKLWMLSALLLSAAIVLPFAAVHSRAKTAEVLQGQGNTSSVGDAQAQKAQWIKELNNWGRWGPSDELGALNLVTPAKRAQALALAKTGEVVSLSRPITLSETPAASGSSVPGPFFEMRVRSPNPPNPAGDYNVDVQSFAYHGMAYTHLDGLCHASYDGKLYNGYTQDQVVDPQRGCQKMGIQLLKDGIITRGVLVDFPRLRGVTSLPPSERLTPVDIEAWEKMAGVSISSGDALFLYVGWKPGAQGPLANYDPSVVTFLKARGVTLLGADAVSGDHQLNMTGLGMYLIDNADLGPLAAAAARLRRWDFLLVVSPIPTPGATGSIVNPLAVF